MFKQTYDLEEEESENEEEEIYLLVMVVAVVAGAAAAAAAMLAPVMMMMMTATTVFTIMMRFLNFKMEDVQPKELVFVQLSRDDAKTAQEFIIMYICQSHSKNNAVRACSVEVTIIIAK